MSDKVISDKKRSLQFKVTFIFSFFHDSINKRLKKSSFKWISDSLFLYSNLFKRLPPHSFTTLQPDYFIDQRSNTTTYTRRIQTFTSLTAKPPSKGCPSATKKRFGGQSDESHDLPDCQSDLGGLFRSESSLLENEHRRN